MRLVGPLLVVSAAGLLVAEAAMRPTTRDRLVLYVIFGSVALVAIGISWWMTAGWGLRSLRTTLQIVAISSVLIVGVAVAAAAWSMVLNVHDLRVVLVALGLGVALGVTVALTVTRRLTADLDALVRTVQAVGDGDLTVRTGIARADELGTTATQVDQMIDRLAEARRVREADEAARRDFLAAVSHDLRTPLTGMRVAVEAIEDDVVDDPDRYLKRIKADIDTMATLIDDLSVLTSFEAGGVKPDQLVDLAELADETVEAMAALAAAGNIDLVVRASDAPAVAADPAALGRALRNLVDNALRYAPDGSQVVVEVDREPRRALLTVQDQGPGFPADFVDRAFERFTTADPSRRRGSGTGLGLAIARSVVEAHGGEIWIDPSGPSGGRVALALPIS